MKQLSSLLLVVFSFTGFSLAQVTEPVPDYIRFTTSPDKSKPDFLETAVSRFQKGDHTIDLVAVVHLGDAEYFKMLKFSLRPYDAVFYEMVGGPYSEEKARQSREVGSKDGNLAQIQGLQQMAKNMLGLEFQLDGLDYLAKNFVHADMTAEEFSEQSQGGQDLSNMLARAMKIAQTGKFKGMPSSEAEANRMMMMLFGAVMSGNSNELKRVLAPILSEAESFISQLEEEEGSVLISKRNQIVIDKIQDTVGPNQKRTDAVLYGAGHMPDLEMRLKKLGYRKVSTHWSQSWKIGHGVPEKKTDGAAPNLQDLTEQLGNLLKSLQDAQ